MSGSKRQSAYRKSVVEEYVCGYPEPEDGDCVAQVLANRGANIFEINVPGSSSENLAIMPNKFKNLIWLKRNDFVIAEEDASNTSKVRFSIKFILNKDQVKHLKKVNKFPSAFMNDTAKDIMKMDDDIMPAYEDDISDQIEDTDYGAAVEEAEAEVEAEGESLKST